VHSPTTRIDRDRPVPLVSYGELCVYHRLAVRALQSTGLDWEDVFTGPSVTSLGGTVNTGLGVMAITRRRTAKVGMLVWENPPLLKLPDLYSGIYVREGGARAVYEQLADDIAAVFDEPQKANNAACRCRHSRSSSPPEMRRCWRTRKISSQRAHHI
jgi:hypothetical protein